MARAYVQFAVAHPSPYRVMFGGFIESASTDDQFVADAKAAFEVLVDALVEQQNAGDIRRDDPVLMARFVWAIEHDTAMLVIDGQLPGEAQREALEHYTAQRTQHPSAKITLRAEQSPGVDQKLAEQVKLLSLASSGAIAYSTNQ